MSRPLCRPSHLVDVRRPEHSIQSAPSNRSLYLERTAYTKPGDNMADKSSDVDSVHRARSSHDVTHYTFGRTTQPSLTKPTQQCKKTAQRTFSRFESALLQPKKAQPNKPLRNRKKNRTTAIRSRKPTRQFCHDSNQRPLEYANAVMIRPIALLAQCALVESLNHCSKWLRLMGMWCCGAVHVQRESGVGGESHDSFHWRGLCLRLLANGRSRRVNLLGRGGNGISRYMDGFVHSICKPQTAHPAVPVEAVQRTLSTPRPSPPRAHSTPPHPCPQPPLSPLPSSKNRPRDPPL